MKLEHQQNKDNRQVMIQQVTNLTNAVNKLTQGIDSDLDFDSYSQEEILNEYLANTYGTGAVEESKEGDQPEDQPSSTSSSLSCDTLIAPCDETSTATYIRRINGGASTDNATTQPPPAEEARKASADNQIVAQPSPTDVEMKESYNKRSLSPPTTTNSITTIVQLKK